MIASNKLNIHDIQSVFAAYPFPRVDWKRDLHFQTRTTIDTLDYSGSGFNQGSKVVIAATGPPQRSTGFRSTAGPDVARWIQEPPRIVGTGNHRNRSTTLYQRSESSKDLADLCAKNG